MNVDEQFHLLRVALEARATLPMVVGVTSAQPEDGAGFLSAGLGIAFAEADYTTLVLEAEPSGLAHGGSNGLSAIESVRGTPNLYVASLTSTARRPKVQSLLEGLRHEFAVTIFSAGALPASSAALEGIGVADELLIALKLGRTAGRADRALMSLLESYSSKIVGVVPTRPNASIVLERAEATIPRATRETPRPRPAAATAVGLVR